jgi:hypothetical protein
VKDDIPKIKFHTKYITKIKLENVNIPKEIINLNTQ